MARTCTTTISGVQAGSLADSSGIRPGDRLVSLNGAPVCDQIDYMYQITDEHVDVVLKRAENLISLSIVKDAGEDLGLEFAEATFDGIRRCRNRCLFCFVDRLPKGLRKSLYVKDDDFRYSFLFGGFATLTNLTEGDWQRIITQHLSPLHVSIHATNDEVRRRLLGNAAAPAILAQLRRLAEARIRIHAQIVLCAGENDGAELDRTIADLASLPETVLSVAVVPVGLTSYGPADGPRQLNDAELVATLHQIRGWRRRLRPALGRSFVHPGDEFYLRTGTAVPSARSYDGFPQYQNGVGMARVLLDEWARVRRRLHPATGPVPHLTVVTGTLAEPLLQRIVAGLNAAGLDVNLRVIRNQFLGPRVTVSGLLGGTDVVDQLRGESLGDAVVLPRTMFDRDGERTLDERTVADLSSSLGLPVYMAETASAAGAPGDRPTLTKQIEQGNLAERRSCYRRGEGKGMCGIVGYVGDRQAGPIIMEGLRKLEYRGYDSAGIAVLNGGDVQLRRSAGKLDNLEKILNAEPPDGTTGFGHTRWATHGKPSETNAHPHVDCKRRAVVIHNGIVENYLELKRDLRERGHEFRSETDTEVIVHLIEDEITAGASLGEATRRAMLRIKGAHAILAMSADEPGHIAVARLGNAGGVVIGFGQGEMFVASDLPALLEHTRDVIYLESAELALVTKQGVEITRLDGTSVVKTPQKVTMDPVAAAKGGYKHFMLKEIFEQPRAIQDTVHSRLRFAPAEIFLEDVHLSQDDIKGISRIVLTACGTALHAGLIGKFMIEELARIPVEVDYASEFRYRNPLLGDGTLLVAVTQSGETVDTLVSMEEAHSRGIPTLAIVNVVGSQASRLADHLIYTHAGPEIGVASTKAFTSQLAALYLLAVYLGQKRGVLSEAQVAGYLQDLSELPQTMGELLEREYPYERLAGLYYRVNDFLYLGRGINYPIALEGALKLKEISYIHAEGYPAGEMKHGPIALIDSRDSRRGHRAARQGLPQDARQYRGSQGARWHRHRPGRGRRPGDRHKSRPRAQFATSLRSLLAPILAVVPLQLLAYYIAVRRGCDVDQPRNLAKSVTVE